MKALSIAVVALAAIMIGGLPVLATTYVYPTFTLTPSSIAQGGSVTLVISNGSGSSLPPYLNGGYCTAGTGPYQGFTIDHVQVTAPDGQYDLLGTASDSLGPSNYIMVGPSDTINSIVFGPNVGWMTVVTSYGTYNLQWWNATTSTPANPTPSTETNSGGVWNVDFAGHILCGSSQTGELVGRSSFDVSQDFTVPQFGLAAAAVASVSLVGLAMFRRLKLPSK